MCIFRVAQIEENRKYLAPTVEGILLCRREELSLRGHRGNVKMVMDGKL